MRTKTYSSRKFHSKYKNYLPENVLKAEVEAKSKQRSIRRATHEYGIPYNTLRDMVNGRKDSDKFGKETLF
ncbi:hypothetical protein DPMN_062841 [Dreissena polymorpha]|uniref:HTH psq-type domain-containing protein n=1 Tax=Dreissena polymorpha TaxID=45954 RepID=A0A9D4CAB6_DREPO|nr:hypothetical protein DPMN_062841 [Dreissena polymorpha]